MRWAKGNLIDGVLLNDEGGLLRIAVNHLDTSLPPHWDRYKADNRILQVCRGLSEEGRQVILVSRDTNMRVKAVILDVPAEDFRNEKVAKIEDQYTGRAEVYAESEVIDRFFQGEDRHISVNELRSFDEASQSLLQPVLTTNQFLLIRSTDNEKQTALGRFDGSKVVHLKYRNHTPFGVTPRNIGQIFMQECLMLGADECTGLVL